MSERWGICKACGGQGEVWVESYTVSNPSGSTTTCELKECGMCMGTPGYSGDAFEMHLRPKRAKPRITPSHEYAIEQAVKALEGKKK